MRDRFEFRVLIDRLRWRCGWGKRYFVILVMD